MAETTMPSSSDGPAGEAAGGPRIDWVATLAEHDRWLRTVVLTRLGERQAVDEVMQEVALAAVAQRAPLTDPSRVGAWLYRLAVRLVLLYRRKCGRQRKLIGSYAWHRRAEREVGSGSGPLDWLLQDERDGLVRQALGRLPRRDAEIILLKYTEDWSYKELAERLGITASAVEARLHRARQRLRQALLDAGTIEESQ
jgi:RNA polymerase sigma-70 factor (ECF subfamily)